MKKILFLSLFAIAIVTSKAQNSQSFGDTIGIWDVFNFDTTYQPIYIDTAATNLWQVGAPQKPIFNASYSPMRAMVTDTVTNYPVNNHSWFDVYIGNFNYGWAYPMSIFVDFKHKINSDTLRDGGYITASWDNGATWTNIINDSVFNWGAHPGSNWIFPDLNLYTTQDTLYNGEFGFSGNSNGWVHTSFAWYLIPVLKVFPPDTMILRFNFISDNNDNAKEGWMIDDLRLFSIDLGGDINELNGAENIFTCSPNPFSETTDLKFNKLYKNIGIQLFDMQGKLVLAGNYSNCDHIKLNCEKLPQGMFLLKATVDGTLTATKKVVLKN